MPDLVVQMEEEPLGAACCATLWARRKEQTRARRQVMAGFEDGVKQGHSLMVEEVVSEFVEEPGSTPYMRRRSVHERNKGPNTKYSGNDGREEATRDLKQD